jgi:hypothetical protein
MPEDASSCPQRLRPAQPSDREHFARLYARCDLLSCEYSLGNLIAWGGIYGSRWCEFRGATVIHLRESDDLLFPVGATLSAAELVDLSLAFCAAGHAGAFYQAPAGLLDRRPELRSCFTATAHEDYADYLHRTERLAELNGEKLNKKRNLIRQFERSFPGARTLPLGPEHAAACLALTAQWSQGREEWRAEREDEAIAAAFASFAPSGFEGVGLFNGADLLAFCIYSLMGESAVVHFEKAVPGIKGAAQAINRETARALLGRCRHINREQDLGHPGLRRAKRSYDPDLMLVPEFLELKSLPGPA